MSDSVFSKDFLWGAASAAAQIEGGWNADGRTPSIWDIASEKRIKNGDSCRDGCDHFHHWREDVTLMKQMGLKSYRFSISWSRIIPEEGSVSQAGLQFYSNLIDALQAAGIEPMITVYHWDLPVWSQKKGGWLSSGIIKDFAFFTKTVVEAYSDRVTYWMTMNEPQCFIMNGHMTGIHAPFKKRYLALSKMTRNCMLAHGEAVRVMRKHARRPIKVGIAMAAGAFIPEDETANAIALARRQSFEDGMGLMNNRWWADPILAGKPVTAYGIYRSHEKDMAKIHQPLDFVGLNIYAPFQANSWGNSSMGAQVGGPRNALGWIIDERVMYWTVRFMYERYHLPIMITENGLAAHDTISLDGAVHDPKRIDFLYRYLSQLKRAVSEQYPVIGYQHWSVMDNFEWAEGYEPRFGLIYVDYETKVRILKDSASAYREIIETNGGVL